VNLLKYKIHIKCIFPWNQSGHSKELGMVFKTPATRVLSRTLAGRGFAGDALRCEFRQAVQACLGIRASRLIPQKPRRALREF
jgi:hypothetical protein